MPYKGPVSGVLHQLAGGLRAAMGYVGAKDLAEFQREGGPSCASPMPACAKATPHDVTITRESPNYPGGI